MVEVNGGLVGDLSCNEVDDYNTSKSGGPFLLDWSRERAVVAVCHCFSYTGILEYGRCSSSPMLTDTTTVSIFNRWTLIYHVVVCSITNKQK
ncbi:hypothetical protein M0802_005206 [Mischocyttarus mexicanus]|nr:hypothetical protein M0802_005206 [Mischocyttarus mexicanus]